MFDDIEKFKKLQKIETLKDITVYDISKDSIQITIIADQKTVSITLINIIYMSKMSSNFLFTFTLLDNDFKVSMKSRKSVEILKDDVLISNTIREGQLYRLKTTSYAKRTTTLSMPKEKNIEV